MLTRKQVKEQEHFLVVCASELQFSCSILSFGRIGNTQPILAVFITGVEMAFQRSVSLSLVLQTKKNKLKMKSLEGLSSGRVLLEQEQSVTTEWQIFSCTSQDVLLYNSRMPLQVN